MKKIAHSRFTRLGLTGLGIILAGGVIHAFTSAVAVAQPVAAAKSVSYKVVTMNVNANEPASGSFIEAQLNTYGASGWRLVGIDRSLYILSK